MRGWPSAIQFLLRKYTTNANIQQALEKLRATKKQREETEDELLTRFEKDHARAGSLRNDRERKSRFIERIDPRVRPLIHRYREERPHADIIDVLETANHHGEAIRLQLGSVRTTDKRTSSTSMTKRYLAQVSLAEDNNSSSGETIFMADVYP